MTRSSCLCFSFDAEVSDRQLRSFKHWKTLRRRQLYKSTACLYARKYIIKWRGWWYQCRQEVAERSFVGRAVAMLLEKEITKKSGKAGKNERKMNKQGEIHEQMNEQMTLHFSHFYICLPVYSIPVLLLFIIIVYSIYDRWYLFSAW